MKPITKKILIPSLIILVLGGLYGGSYGLIQNRINNGDSSTSEGIKITDFRITKLLNTTIYANLSISLTDSLIDSSIDAELSSFSIYYHNHFLGSVNSTPTIFPLNQLTYVAFLQFDLVSKDFISIIIEDYLKNNTLNFRINGKIKLNKALAVYPAFLIRQSFTFSRNQINEDNTMQLVDIQIHNIFVSLSNLTYGGQFSLFINNPLDFAFNITYLKGLLRLDDLDGVSSLGVTILQPKENVSIANINLDWQIDPFIIPAHSNRNRTFTFEDDTLTVDATTRLSNELSKDQLIIDIINAEIGIEIAGYDWAVPFNLNDVSFDISSI